MDPEALLLFTLEVGREDPRLLDEALDWFVRNESLVSVHRLRTLCDHDVDRALVEALLAWAGRWGPRSRSIDARPVEGSPTVLEPLFRGIAAPSRNLDPAFSRYGFARAELKPSGKSRAPDYLTPISFAFRLRRLVGIGAKAEVLRALLTIRAPRLQTKLIATSAAYAPRNVREALSQLVDAGVVDVVVFDGERQYTAPTARWAPLLGLEPPSLPFHFDWIGMFRALKAMLRWSQEPFHAELSDYMRSSQARTLLAAVVEDLRFAGVPVGGPFPAGADGMRELEQAANAAITHARGPRR